MIAVAVAMPRSALISMSSRSTRAAASSFFLVRTAAIDCDRALDERARPPFSR